MPHKLTKARAMCTDVTPKCAILSSLLSARRITAGWVRCSRRLDRRPRVHGGLRNALEPFRRADVSLAHTNRQFACGRHAVGGALRSRHTLQALDQSHYLLARLRAAAGHRL